MEYASIDEYLAALPEGQRRALERLRRVVHDAVPGCTEGFSYGMPAIRYEGRVLVSFAARRGHLALYPMSGVTVAAFAAELADFDTSKGTIRFQPGHLIPDDLIRRIARARIEENRR